MSHFYRIKYTVSWAEEVEDEIEQVVECKLPLDSVPARRLLELTLKLRHLGAQIADLRVADAAHEYQQAEVETKKIIEKMMS